MCKIQSKFQNTAFLFVDILISWQFYATYLLCDTAKKGHLSLDIIYILIIFDLWQGFDR